MEQECWQVGMVLPFPWFAVNRCAPLGSLRKACNDSTLRDGLGFDRQSQVLLFGVEGATDPRIYGELVGSRPETVSEAQQNFMQAVATERLEITYYCQRERMVA